MYGVCVDTTNEMSVRERYISSKLRFYYEKNYYEVYLNEYDAVILHDCYAFTDIIVVTYILLRYHPCLRDHSY